MADDADVIVGAVVMMYSIKSDRGAAAEAAEVAVAERRRRTAVVFR